MRPRISLYSCSCRPSVSASAALQYAVSASRWAMICGAPGSSGCSRIQCEPLLSAYLDVRTILCTLRHNFAHIIIVQTAGQVSLRPHTPQKGVRWRPRSAVHSCRPPTKGTATCICTGVLTPHLLVLARVVPEPVVVVNPRVAVRDQLPRPPRRLRRHQRGCTTSKPITLSAMAARPCSTQIAADA